MTLLQRIYGARGLDHFPVSLSKLRADGLSQLFPLFTPLDMRGCAHSSVMAGVLVGTSSSCFAS